MKLLHSQKAVRMVNELLDLDKDPNSDAFVSYHAEYDHVIDCCRLVEKSITTGKPIVEVWTDLDGWWYLGTVKEVEVRLSKQLEEARAEQVKFDAEWEELEAQQAAKEVKRLEKELEAKKALAAKAKPVKGKKGK